MEPVTPSVSNVFGFQIAKRQRLSGTCCSAKRPSSGPTTTGTRSVVRLTSKSQGAVSTLCCSAPQVQDCAGPHCKSLHVGSGGRTLDPLQSWVLFTLQHLSNARLNAPSLRHHLDVFMRDEDALRRDVFLHECTTIRGLVNCCFGLGLRPGKTLSPLGWGWYNSQGPGKIAAPKCSHWGPEHEFDSGA